MSPSAPTKQVALFLGGAAVPAAPTKQTVHPQNKLIRGHGILPCPLCVFPPGDACSPHGMHGTHRSLGCVFSHRTHLGGYGILPYPRRPLDNSPTDGTDAHRWFGCVEFSHGIHGIHRSFWRRIFSHRFHRCSQMVRLRRVLPRNSQKLLAEKSLPQISQMHTDG